MQLCLKLFLRFSEFSIFHFLGGFFFLYLIQKLSFKLNLNLGGTKGCKRGFFQPNCITWTQPCYEEERKPQEQGLCFTNCFTSLWESAMPAPAPPEQGTWRQKRNKYLTVEVSACEPTSFSSSFPAVLTLPTSKISHRPCLTPVLRCSTGSEICCLTRQPHHEWIWAVCPLGQAGEQPHRARCL